MDCSEYGRGRGRPYARENDIHPGSGGSSAVSLSSPANAPAKPSGALPRKRDIREIENESLEEECHLARGHRHRCAGFELKLQLGEYSWCCMWRHSNLRCLWIIVLVMWGGLKGRLWSGVLIIDWALQF